MWPLVRDLCARLLSGRSEAEDAAQRALVKLFANASNFDSERDVLSWAFAIAGWECRTLRRSRRSTEALPVGLAGGGSPEETVMQRELEVEAARLIGELSPIDREALLEAFGPDPSAAMESAAFRKRKERALRRLRLAWRSRHGSE